MIAISPASGRFHPQSSLIEPSAFTASACVVSCSISLTNALKSDRTLPTVSSGVLTVVNAIRALSSRALASFHACVSCSFGTPNFCSRFESTPSRGFQVSVRNIRRLSSAAFLALMAWAYV